MKPTNERPDQWHPIYSTFSEWLAAEGGPPAEFGIAKPLNRKKNKTQAAARRTTRTRKAGRR